MATVTKTFTFDSTIESLVYQNIETRITFGWVNAGSPSAGGIEFATTSKNVDMTDQAMVNASTETWESWGVPAGATVTNVQITGWNRRLGAAPSKLTSHDFTANIYANDGTTAVHDGGALLNAVALPTSGTTWGAGTTSTLRNVTSGYQASNTPIRFSCRWHVITAAGGGSASVQAQFDTIAIQVTYTPVTTIVNLNEGTIRKSGNAVLITSVEYHNTTDDIVSITFNNATTVNAQVVLRDTATAGTTHVINAPASTGPTTVNSIPAGFKYAAGIELRVGGAL